MTKPPADDLFVRYMEAFADSEEHTTSCAACQAGQQCTEGGPLHERFAGLQDAHRERQSKRQRR